MPQVMLSKHCVRTTFSFVVPPLRIEKAKNTLFMKICIFWFVILYVNNETMIWLFIKSCLIIQKSSDIEYLRKNDLEYKDSNQ